MVRAIFMRLVLPASLLVLCAVTVRAEDAKPLTYEKDVRPIFRVHCFDCHGATAELKAGLDLRLVRTMTKGGESGPAITAGRPATSLLLERITKGEMPPGDTRLSAEEIATLTKWLTQGAKTARPEPKTLGVGLKITLEERAYWAFQPIKRPQPLPPSARVRSPLDALLMQEMPKGLTFSPDADRLTLIKRVYFDLIGLPPSEKELTAALNDKQSDWYEKLIDQLLKSPHYGERWGRHWLDVAGYADSEGYTTKDEIRPWAWKYRDYVIASLNKDKPFDRFITEQLAGDELAVPRTGDLTAEQMELLTATGFLRMAADGTGSGANNPDGRNKVMTDTIKIVSSSLLGMSVACAQCHDHRYDPIPQTDYYALRAVLEPALNWKKWQTPQQRRMSLYTAADRKQAAEVEAEAKKLSVEKGKKQAEYMAQALAVELKKYEQPLRDQLQAAYKAPAKSRTDAQKQLLKKHPSVNITTGNLYQYLPKSKTDLKKYDDRIAAIRTKKPKEEFLRVLLEQPGQAIETKLFHRGDHKQPKQVVQPGGLSVVSSTGERLKFSANDAKSPTTGRRLAFARWLTDGKNPLVARVIANRIWLHHFGRGIVGTPGDFGRLGMTPTHPKLLDWLAAEFMQQGWSMQQMHRTIIRSTAYRQSSVLSEKSKTLDPDNFYYSRKPLLRLEAETIRDRMLATAGVLDRKLFGPPLTITEDDAGMVTVKGEQKRRSVYIQVRRSQPIAMLQAFDAPVMETNCDIRTSSTVATQSLMLLNGSFILRQGRSLADRVVKEATPLDEKVTVALPKLPAPAAPVWQFGYGEFDPEAKSMQFTPLPHFTGSAWQGGPKLPDPKHNWAILNANGGHPGKSPGFHVIRRWVAPSAGMLSISGKLSHGSENGDGVRGRIVSSRSGLKGEWTVHNSGTDTNATGIAVEAGDTIDFITDGIAAVTSDSFSWPVQITLKGKNVSTANWASASGFHGPMKTEGYAGLPAQAARAWQLAYCRNPNLDEMILSVAFLAKQLDHFAKHNTQLPKDTTAARQALTNFCQALLTSNEFLYVE
jgi:mono/diheme cytochrome c family protein